MNTFFPEGSKMSTRVVYDKKTGAVVHVHRVLSMPGAKNDAAGIDARAMELATHMTKRKAGEIAVLRIDNDQLQPRQHYKVDVERGQLVAAATSTGGKSGRKNTRN